MQWLPVSHLPRSLPSVRRILVRANGKWVLSWWWWYRERERENPASQSVIHPLLATSCLFVM